LFATFVLVYLSDGVRLLRSAVYNLKTNEKLKMYRLHFRRFVAAVSRRIARDRYSNCNVSTRSKNVCVAIFPRTRLSIQYHYQYSTNYYIILILRNIKRFKTSLELTTKRLCSIVRYLYSSYTTCTTYINYCYY